MSRRRKKNINGLILLDKPTGMTSNAALQKVKQLFNAKKAGHTGSLDPLASGLLPICMGEGTKLSAYLLDADKRYELTARWGEQTDTGDADGEVIARSDEALTEEKLIAVLDQFRGDIEQIPPMYSALKHKGKRLYELARAGEVVEREPRPIRITELLLNEVTEDSFKLTVACSKGTYVRTLVEDIAAAAGSCAHVIQLRRTGVGALGEQDMVTLSTLEQAATGEANALFEYLRPLDQALPAWPEVSLSADSAFYLQNGNPVQVPTAPTSGWLRLYDDQQRFIGVGEILKDGRVAPRRLFSKIGHRSSLRDRPRVDNQLNGSILSK